MLCMMRSILGERGERGRSVGDVKKEGRGGRGVMDDDVEKKMSYTVQIRNVELVEG